MTLLFYKYTGPEIVFNKTSALALLTPLTISSSEVAGDQDLENVVLHVTSAEHSLSGYNYVYIQDWSRYYYILATRWLANGIYSITLQEDYLQTWASVVPSTYQGIARYSGLGDSNLVDPRCTFKPSSKLESFPVEPKSPALLEDWYCVKFISEQPFVGVTTNKCTVNIAILNSAGYSAFTAAYKAKSETARVKIAQCIISVNRARYMDPDDSSLGGSVYQVQFKSPYSEPGGSGGTAETLSWTIVNNEKCYIITSPDEVWYLKPAYFQVSATGGGSAKVFNTSSRFYELNAQYIIRLKELQPITFSPATFGLKSNFSIYMSVGYEPYGENYVILFGNWVSGALVSYGFAPIAQRCQTAVSFITDNTLNMHEEATLANTLGLIGGISGGAFKVIGGTLTADVIGIAGGVGDIVGANNTYKMKEKQMEVAEFAGMGLTGTVGGSIDWSRDAQNASGWCYVITQEPVATFWSVRGKPDGALRSFLALAGTGYAEIDLIDPPALSGATYNEMRNLKAALAQGAIF